MQASVKGEVCICPCQKLQAWNPVGQPHQFPKAELSFVLEKFAILQSLT